MSQLVTVFFKYDEKHPDINSAETKDLYDFLETNLASFTKAGLTFKFELIDKKDSKAFKSLKNFGIAELPAVAIGSKKIWNNAKIKKALVEYSKTRKNTMHDPSEDAADFQLEAARDLLKKGDKKDRRVSDRDVSDRINKFTQRRKGRNENDDNSESSRSTRPMLALSNDSGDEEDEPGSERDAKPRSAKRNDEGSSRRFDSARNTDPTDIERIAKNQNRGNSDDDMFSKFVSGHLTES
jgi:hypothetical protein